MESFAVALAGEGVATLRYEFPYMEKGARRIDPKPVLHARVREAVEHARGERLPLFAGGKSFGGRMTSQAQALEPLPDVRGIAFAGFPLHPARKPGIERAEHLRDVEVPMLFMQGTRDDLADLSLLKPIVAALPQATLHVIEGADHSLRRSIDELARTFAAWARPLAQRPSGESSSRASRSAGSR
jgi:predicted alpha/beta-hydrolase family hydrolase